MQTSLLPLVEDQQELAITTAEPNEYGVYEGRPGKHLKFTHEHVEISIQIIRVEQDVFIGSVDSRYNTGSCQGSLCGGSRSWGEWPTYQDAVNYWMARERESALAIIKYKNHSCVDERQAKVARLVIAWCESHMT